jgi:hypothetical protein
MGFGYNKGEVHLASPFSAIPRSNVESKATQPVEEESSVLALVIKEVLTWFFSVNGKHRNLFIEQSPFADGYAIDPVNTKQQKINIYNLSTYVFRREPAIIIQVGSPRVIKTGLGIAVEHSVAGNQSNCLQKRNIGKYTVTLIAETSQEQSTNKLAKLLNEIFLQHLPEYYQNVIYGDASNSQIILPQEYTQSEVLSRDFQQDSNVERVYRYTLSFEVEYESIRFIPGYEKLQISNTPGKMILAHDLPMLVHMGQNYIITIKTNLLGVKLYSSRPEIFQILQLSGPHGEGDGDRIYQGKALRIGSFSLKLQDQHLKNVKQSDHKVDF